MLASGAVCCSSEVIVEVVGGPSSEFTNHDTRNGGGDAPPSSSLSSSTSSLRRSEERSVNANKEDKQTPAASSSSSSSSLVKANGSSPINVSMPIRFRILLALSSCSMSISSSTISFYCVNDMNLEPVQLTHYWMFMSWSALLNPVIGFLSDTVRIRGENRRPLVIMGSVIATASFFLFAFVDVTTQNYALFIAISMLQMWAQSFVVVPINGMLVEMFLDDMDAVASPPPPPSVASPTTDEEHFLNGDENKMCANAVGPIGGDTKGIKTVEFSSSSSSSNTTSPVSSTLTSSANSEEEAAVAEAERQKHIRITIMSLIQAQGQFYRSFGSLFGAIVYTIFVIWCPLKTMLWVSAIAYALVIPSVMVLSRSWCLGRIKKKKTTSQKEKEKTETEQEGGNRCNRTDTKKDSDEDDEDKDEKDEQQPLLPRTEKCMGCERRFRCIRDRLFLMKGDGWDWRKPSEGKIGLLFVLFFVFIYSGTLDGGSAYFAFVATQFEFPNWLNSLNSSVGMLGSVVGAYVYGWFIKWLHARNEKRSTTGPTTAGSGVGACSTGAAESPAKEEGCGNATATTAIVDVSGKETPSAGDEADTQKSMLTTTSEDEKNKKKTRRHVTTAFSLFVFGSICGALGYLTNVALASDFIPSVVPIPPYLFVPFDNFLTSLFSRFAFMPIMTVAAERCPVGYEAAVFELFSVASLLGGSLSAYLSGLATVSLGITSKDYSNLWILLCICAGAKFVPVGLAAILPVHEKSATAMLVGAIKASAPPVAAEGNQKKKGAADETDSKSSQS